MKVIFDTDPGGDIDDVGALAVLHALADRGEIEIIAMGASHGHHLTVPYIRAVNAWFGRPNIPVGKTPPPGPYIRDHFIEEMLDQSMPEQDTSETPEAPDLYREILSSQPDASVTIVSVGPPTNIARLLQYPDGVDLVRRKVVFYAAGGNGRGELPSGIAGFNYHQDNSAARVELALMPVEVPMVFAGGSGLKLELGECYKKASKGSFVRRSYETYFKNHNKTSFDRPTWDQLRVLYGCRPSSRAFFTTSQAGDISLDCDHHLKWSAQPNRNKSYAYVSDFDEIRRQLTELMMHEPGS